MRHWLPVVAHKNKALMEIKVITKEILIFVRLMLCFNQSHFSIPSAGLLFVF